MGNNGVGRTHGRTCQILRLFGVDAGVGLGLGFAVSAAAGFGRGFIISFPEVPKQPKHTHTQRVGVSARQGVPAQRAVPRAPARSRPSPSEEAALPRGGCGLGRTKEVQDTVEHKNTISTRHRREESDRFERRDYGGLFVGKHVEDDFLQVRPHLRGNRRLLPGLFS